MATQQTHDDRFDRFWQAYPRHTAKAEALKVWRKMMPSDTVVEAILTALCWQREQRSWREGFIPHPATYLRQERWTDEPVDVVVRRDIPSRSTWVCDHEPAHLSRWACERYEAMRHV